MSNWASSSVEIVCGVAAGGAAGAGAAEAGRCDADGCDVDDCGVDGWCAGDCDSCACEGAEAAVRVRLLRNRALNLPVAALHCGSGVCSMKTLLTSVASGLNSSALSGIESVSARSCAGLRSAAEGAGAAGSGSFGGGKAGCERVGDATPVTVVPRSSESRASALNTFEQRP